MNTTQNAGRQYSLTAIQDWTVADLVAGALASNTTAAATVPVGVKLPTNAIIDSCGILVETAVSGGGITAATAVLGVTGTTNKFTSSALDLTAAGWHAGSGVMVPEYDGADVLLTPTFTGGTPTAGAGKLIVKYLVENRVNELQTN